MAISNGNTSASKGQIPVIDISGSRPETEVAKELVDAAATYGFVYIKNEGKDIPVEVINDVFQLVRYHKYTLYQVIDDWYTFTQSKSFFKSPIEEKKSCIIQKDNRGWVGMHAETLDSKSQRVGISSYGPHPYTWSLTTIQMGDFKEYVFPPLEPSYQSRAIIPKTYLIKSL